MRVRRARRFRAAQSARNSHRRQTPHPDARRTSWPAPRPLPQPTTSTADQVRHVLLDCRELAAEVLAEAESTVCDRRQGGAGLSHSTFTTNLFLPL